MALNDVWVTKRKLKLQLKVENKTEYDLTMITI